MKEPLHWRVTHSFSMVTRLDLSGLMTDLLPGSLKLRTELSSLAIQHHRNPKGGANFISSEDSLVIH